MLVREVLKEHVNDDAVRVTDGHSRIEWNGKGIASLILRTANYTEWLDREVKEVSFLPNCYKGITIVNI